MPRKPFPCAHCGINLQPGSTSLPQGEAMHNACRTEAIKLRGPKPATKATCIECGNNRALIAKQKCSTCYTKAWRAQHQQARQDIRRRRRARQASATIEHFQSQEVFDRDAWKCKHCGTPVTTYQDNTWHADRATLDHIKPLSKGGEHSLQNTQCLCHQCNARKGATDETLAQIRRPG